MAADWLVKLDKKQKASGGAEVAPLDVLFASPRPPSSTESKRSKTEKNIAKKVAEVSVAGGSDELKAAAKEIAEPTDKSWLMKFLGVLDMPRAAVNAVVTEAGERLDPHGDGARKQSESGSFLSDVKAKIDKGEGFGDYLERVGRDRKKRSGKAHLFGENEVLDNKWAKRGLGFLGDVSMDPLTYLGGTGVGVKGASGTGKTAKLLKHADAGPRLAKWIAEGAGIGDDAANAARLAALAPGGAVDARKALDLGVDAKRARDAVTAAERLDMAARVEKYGLGALKRAEYDKLGLVAPKASFAGIPLPGTGGVTRVGSQAKGRIGAAVGDITSPVTELFGEEGLRTARNAARNRALKGESGTLVDRLVDNLKGKATHPVNQQIGRQARDSLVSGRGIERGVAAQFGKQANDIVKLLDKAEKQSPGLGRRIVEAVDTGSRSGRQALNAEGHGPLVTAVEGWFKSFRDEVNSQGIGKVIAERRNYIPHQMTPKGFASYVEDATKGSKSWQPGKFTPAAMERHRESAKTLTQRNDAAALARKGKGLRPIGDQFETDLRKIMESYLNSASRRAGEASTLANLVDSGIVDRGARSLDDVTVAKYGHSAPSATGKPRPLELSGDELVKAALRPEVRKQSDIGKATGKAVDRVMAPWKQYALLSPGFHVRNTIGGMVNHYMDDVSGASQLDYLLNRGKQKLGMKLDPEDAKLMALIDQYGMSGGGQLMDEYGKQRAAKLVGPAGIRRGVVADPNATKTEKVGEVLSRLYSRTVGNQMPVAKASKAAGDSVEGFLRGAHALDVLKRRGGTVDDALHQVAKFQFDYDDLSQFERNVMKRIAPFYTWQSRNLPLQAEMLAENPKKLKRLLDVQRNAQLGTEDDPVVPEYLRGEFGVRTDITSGDLAKIGNKLVPFADPFDETQTGRIYATPDIPTAQAGEMFGKGGRGAMGSVSPLIKTPLELMAGKQFFNNAPLTDKLAPLPESWKPVLPALRGAGMIVDAKDGTPLISQKNAYIVEQANPLAGRSRRLAPSEDRFESRLLSSWLSFSGVPVQTNTPEAQASELYQRDQQLGEFIKREQEKGNLHQLDPKVKAMLAKALFPPEPKAKQPKAERKAAETKSKEMDAAVRVLLGIPPEEKKRSGASNTKALIR